MLQNVYELTTRSVWTDSFLLPCMRFRKLQVAFGYSHERVSRCLVMTYDLCLHEKHFNLPPMIPPFTTFPGTAHPLTQDPLILAATKIPSTSATPR